MSATKSVTREQEQMIRENMALVGHMVREMLFKVPAHVHRDDLASAGYAALVTAARGFDAGRGIPFGRFAAMRVRGALLDELRSMDWASRSVRARARRAETARAELTAQLGRTPSPEELAELLGVAVGELSTVDDDVQRAAVLSLQGFTAGSAETARAELTAQLGRTPSPEELAELLGVAVGELSTVDDDVQRAAVLSLQGFTAGSADDLVTDSSMNPEEMLLHRERIGYLHDAVAVLPERLRFVVEASFLQERPLAEVAAELGVTESRVSQLRGEALAMLKDGLATSMENKEAAKARDGCVSRRRAVYAAQIAARSTMASRLGATDIEGLRVAA